MRPVPSVYRGLIDQIPVTERGVATLDLDRLALAFGYAASSDHITL